MCSVRPVLAGAVVLGVGYLIFRKAVDHVLLIIGQFAMITVLTLLCLIIAWGTFLIVRGIKRRRASEGGCLACPFHCQGEIEAPPKDNKVTSLMDWKERYEDPA